MTQAMELFVYIWRKIINTMFSTFQIETGVTVGWVILTVSVIVLIIRSILNLPIGVFTSGTRTVNTQTGITKGNKTTLVRTRTVTKTSGRGRY